jgi:hypothetical protein
MSVCRVDDDDCFVYSIKYESLIKAKQGQIDTQSDQIADLQAQIEEVKR